MNKISVKYPHLMINLFFYFILSFLGISCSSSDDLEALKKHKNQKGEFIYRKHNESLSSIPFPEKNGPKIYPWNHDQIGNLPKITKEYFRCKGSSLNPYHIKQIKGETFKEYDCCGTNKHSLPLKDGKEFIYPILLELVNYIQESTGKRVVITCGHRCPIHQIYADPANLYSKHMIAAEVTFYVKGMEEKPMQLVKLIQNYYKINPFYRGNLDYEEFKRYEKNDVNTTILPWYNKEIFIKIYNEFEGRNFDNRHPYPYLSIQVRHDKDTDEKVTYTWDKANRNYHRW